MTLFGHTVKFGQTKCVGYVAPGKNPQPFVNLYVRITDGCNARCDFYCTADAGKSASFDIRKFAEVIDEIRVSGIRINRITMTGGEPSCRPATVRAVTEIVGRSPHCHFTQLQLHTNGLTAESKKLIALRRIDAVSLSLHHYDYAKLSEIYGRSVPENLLEFPDVLKSKINLSCNLIKGYIDNPAEIAKLLRFAANGGFISVGFAGLMKLNSYAADHYVNPWMIDFECIPALLKIEEKSHERACRCRNFLYTDADTPVGVYVRETIDTDYCASSLLFDGEYLRQGFNKSNIIY